jgi:hypothetical protein
MLSNEAAEASLTLELSYSEVTPCDVPVEKSLDRW